MLKFRKFGKGGHLPVLVALTACLLAASLPALAEDGAPSAAISNEAAPMVPAATGSAAPEGALLDDGAPDDAADATLPRDLSPWSMFLNADVVVKAVLIGLAFASVLTWTVWLAKTMELVAARRRVAASLRAIAVLPGLTETRGQVAASDGAVHALLAAAETEMRLSDDVAATGKEGIK